MVESSEIDQKLLSLIQFEASILKYLGLDEHNVPNNAP